MRIVLQRVSRASVTVNEQTSGKIYTGLLLFAGFENGDNEQDIDLGVRKVINMRIFPDESRKMNKSLTDIKGEVLVVSQFTLHASVKKGNRPSFVKSAAPQFAKDLYLQFVEKLGHACVKPVQTGRFGEMMQVELINNGPVTILIDTKEIQAQER